ncbi:AI-2E family transporter [Microbacterium pseudoresistens]|uniref:Putative PurR-regulated permease PerM n=1 Tax=Microbacterium pseudoresistens TaxID=640634 RepID=A0A7Y9EWK4_9MICO|nr:AI-2E family transporter [Microbacterium pseudoresistens]NYD55277.1 putative PurR-regulated permease PerM [Microbacterium pseudoresistens]
MKLHNPFRTALVATLGVGLGIMLINSVQTLSTILLYVGTALFLSLGLDPAITFLTRHRVPRWAAVLITILAVLGVFAGIVLMVLPILIDQISQLVRRISYFLQSTALDDVKDWILSVFPGLQPSFLDDLMTNASTWLLDNWGSITEGVVAVGTSIVTGLAGAFIVLILTIYFTAAVPSLKASVYQLVPASKRPRFVDLAEQITASVGYYVMGQVTMGIINGVLSAVFLSIVRAPFPAVLAVIAFFFSLIPLVGTLTGSTIIVLVCLIPGLGGLPYPMTAIIAAIYYLIYMQVEAYIISPRVMNRAVSVPAAVVVIAALAGGSLLGLLGALIAIPVAASILIIYRQVLIPRMNER